MARRVGYWLGVAALVVGSAAVVSLVWRGAAVAPGLRSLSLRAITMGKPGVYIHPNTSAEFRTPAITTVVALVALPWIARRRGAFGPVADSWVARLAQVGGSAAIYLLVLVLARLAQRLGERSRCGRVPVPEPEERGAEGSDDHVANRDPRCRGATLASWSEEHGNT